MGKNTINGIISELYIYMYGINIWDILLFTISIRMIIMDSYKIEMVIN
jgi:hypothetical protein